MPARPLPLSVVLATADLVPATAVCEAFEGDFWSRLPEPFNSARAHPANGFTIVHDNVLRDRVYIKAMAIQLCLAPRASLTQIPS